MEVAVETGRAGVLGGCTVGIGSDCWDCAGRESPSLPPMRFMLRCEIARTSAACQCGVADIHL